MPTFDELKKNSAVKIEDLVKNAKAAAGGDKKSYDDDRFWKPTRDKKTGNGYAVIRFLPAPDQPTPWIQYWDHFFKGPTGRWYVEKSLTTLAQDDPVSEVNSELWNREGTEAEVKANREVVRSRKRKLHYVANILVVKDPANPENDGKTFLYDFGSKIFDKIMGAMTPEFEDQKAINPFDMFKGANFNLRIKKVAGYPNYDESTFGEVEEVAGGNEAKMKAIYEATHAIGEFNDPKNFKSYDELKRKLEQVLGTAGSADESFEPQAQREAPAQDARPSFASQEPEATKLPEESDDVDGDMAFFDNVIDDD